jgi:hypothetical protein
MFMQDHETDVEIKQRLSHEAEATRMNDEIDDQLDQKRQQRSKAVEPKMLSPSTRYFRPPSTMSMFHSASIQNISGGSFSLNEQSSLTGAS